MSDEDDRDWAGFSLILKVEAPELEPGVRLSDVICPQCKRPFRLQWNDYSSDNRYPHQTLVVRGCPSGGVYDVSISCPHCDYEEEL